MITLQINLEPFKSFGHIVGKLSTAIVSGIPGEKQNFKPAKKVKVYQRSQNIGIRNSRFSQKPVSKPVFDKHIIVREKGKKG